MTAQRLQDCKNAQEVEDFQADKLVKTLVRTIEPYLFVDLHPQRVIEILEGVKLQVHRVQVKEEIEKSRRLQ